MKHPMQKITKDKDGCNRFVANPIVRYLLDNGGLDLNKLHRAGVGDSEDWDHFNQLIGYSVSGLPSSSDYLNTVAEAVASGVDEREARIEYLETQLKALKESLRLPMSRLFGIHEEDLEKGI